MYQIFNSRTCIIVNDLVELEKIKKFDLEIPKCFIFVLNFDLNIHYNYNEKQKIVYSKNQNLYQLIDRERIESIVFINLNIENINQASFVAANFKSNIKYISFFCNHSYKFEYSKNFYTNENDDKDNWRWNYGDSAISNLKIINFFPFKIFFNFNVRWPFLINIQKNNMDEKNILIDDENNSAENIENKDFNYFCEGFNVKTINFFFNKKTKYDSDPRNLNFSIHNLDIINQDFNENFLNKNNIYKNIFNNFYNNFEIYNLKIKDRPAVKIKTFNKIDQFEIKILDEVNLKLLNSFISFNNIL